jgi:glutathione peroxidase-family protein/uncharacterized membrane protein
MIMNQPSQMQNFFKILLGLNLLFAGIGHLTFARIEFIAQVPKWLPMEADLVVVLSGLVEIALGLSLLSLWRRNQQKIVGIIVATFFILIFPGNISQYVNHISAFGLDTDRARFIRLFFQPILVAWALISTGAWSIKKNKLDLNENLFSFKFKKANGEETSFKDYNSKLFLIVNTASKCGFTNQYEGLEKLHEKYSEKGLGVYAFPCNQFLKQEAGSDKEIQEFCSLNFGVKFPVFQKIEVNGKNAHPLFSYLKHKAPGALGIEAIKWNFTKFLVTKDGKTLKRFSPKTKPEDIEEDIVKLLSNK